MQPSWKALPSGLVHPEGKTHRKRGETMKQLMIVTGLILLGTLIFQMMVGDGPGTLKSSASHVMRQQIRWYSEYGEGGADSL